MKIENVKCEYLTNPIGIDILSPRITWNYKSEGDEKLLQKAFKIHYSINKNNYVSELVESSSMNYIFTNPFKSRDIIKYKIEAIMNDDTHVFSEENSFEIGLLNETDFHAKWISGNYKVKRKTRYPADYFKKEFSIEDLNKITKARAYASACGLYELFINDKKVGDFVLAPGSTDYRKRVQYQTYDILPLLKEGRNEIKIILGDGWYRGNNGGSGKPNTFGKVSKAFLQCEFFSDDKLLFEVLSDEKFSWSNDGPIIFNDIKDGEFFDANLDPTYKGRAKEIHKKYNLKASNNYFVKEKEEHYPIKEITTPKKKHVLLFENNLSGYIAFKLKGKKGDKIRIVMGEYIDNDGEFSLLNIQDHTKYGDTPRQEINYIFKDGINEYKSKFYYGGFKYALIESDVPYELTDFKQIVIYSDLSLISNFECSNNLVNIFFKNTINSLKSNSVDVPTDCPTRERAGWTGDSQIFFNSAAYLMDYAPFIRKHINDLIDRQFKDGRFSHIVPTVNEPFFMHTLNGSVGWADAGILIPYRFYKLYGDKKYLESIYDPMKKYINFMIKRIGKWGGPISKHIKISHKNKKYLVRKGQSYGEWAEPNDIYPQDWKDVIFPHPEVSTAYTNYVLTCFQEIERVLGHEEEAQKLDKYIKGTRGAYQELITLKEFSLDTKRQALLVRPLYMDLLDEEQKKFAQNKLIVDLNDFSWRIGTGFLSTPFILFVLKDIDPEYAYKLLENEEKPGWLYMAKNSTGSIRESWEGVQQNYGLSSLNHYSKGAMVEFLFKAVLGINVNAENSFKIEPVIGGTFKFAKGYYDSLYGRVSASWERENKKINFKISIPPNTKAEFIFKDFQCELVPGINELSLNE